MPRKGGKPEARETVRIEARISVAADVRLYGIARRLGLRKSELAARLIEAGLGRYKEDAELRRLAGEIGGAGEGGGER